MLSPSIGYRTHFCEPITVTNEAGYIDMSLVITRVRCDQTLTDTGAHMYCY